LFGLSAADYIRTEPHCRFEEYLPPAAGWGRAGIDMSILALSTPPISVVSFSFGFILHLQMVSFNTSAYQIFIYFQL